jgi:hypothetical protein
MRSLLTCKICLTLLIAGIKPFGIFVPTVLSRNSNLVFMSGGNAWKKVKKLTNQEHTD